MRAAVTNALLRCRREDSLASPAFELVREEFGLWVRELPESLEGIVADLSAEQDLLRQLRIGSEDYTLHLAVGMDEIHSLLLPSTLLELAAECGFQIEVCLSCR